MKIAIVYDMIYPFSKGGAEVRNLETAKILAKLGHEVHVYGTKMWKGFDDFTEHGIQFHGVGECSSKYNKQGKRNPLDPIIFSLKLFPNLLLRKFDIVDCSSFPYFPAFACYIYCKLRKAKLIITWHEVWMEYWFEYLDMINAINGFVIEKLLTLLTKHMVSVSDLTKERLQILGVKKQHITTIYNGTDIERISKAKKKKETYDIIYAGRLQKHKNVDMIVEATRILKKHNKNIKTVIVGGGPEINKLKQLRKRYKLEKNIKITGFTKDLDEVYSYMRSSKIFVLPSELEGFGIVAIEAGAAKLPVITIDVPRNASKDVIKDGKTGIVINKDHDQLAETINILLNNESLRKQLGEEAHKDVKQHYTWKKVTEKLESLYKRLKR